MHELHTFVDYVLYTKYWEYALAFAFMGSFLVFYIFLRSPARPAEAAEARRAPASEERIQGFLVPEGVYFHQGHTWAKPVSDHEAVIGLDDFAQRLVGQIQAFKLPKVGDELKQGDEAWALNVESKEIGMLSPLDGRVVAVNDKIAKSAGSLKADPFGEGWLVKVESPDLVKRLKNLLSGKLAKVWTQNAVSDLTTMSNASLGVALSDGGEPVDGIAKNLDSQNWDKICRDIFMSN